MTSLFERRIVEPVQIGTFSIENRGGEVSALVVRAPQERVRIEVEMPRDLVGPFGWLILSMLILR